MSSRKRVSVFGVTGSVGRCAQDVILQNSDIFEVNVVTAGKDAVALARAAYNLKAKKAVIAEATHYNNLKKALEGSGIEAEAGNNALIDAAGEEADIMLAASVGFSGLRPIITALSKGTTVAIANKEPLVAAGALVMQTAQKHKAKIVPVDSEHNAIFQVFEQTNKAQIEKITLTASGGPFRLWEREDMNKATIEEALNHPNWKMGQKISIDSATMMNKALEVIEAHHLFDFPSQKIDIIIHPQSIIHGMVHYVDGSVLAQMGPSDMRVPIAHALGWPQRVHQPTRLDFTLASELTFEDPDYDKFPALDMAYDCLKAGSYACIAFNAANEVAVEAFLAGQISFGDIMDCISRVLDQKLEKNLKTVEEIEEYDTMCRALARERMVL